ncbi:uncharacterized protein LOC115209203 [Octopus sinensis]|uniref:Uncharacterized protein LOC115209203 n=1 Tax=Octopus sinensis TaxID=2607531 RepID=A0A6P7S516_9MOLL|nr:uncharacterized protein LOC115209203 [Octopus sinensis]
MQISDQVLIHERSHTKSDEMKDVYGHDASSYAVDKHWYHQFKCGRTSMETAPIRGRPHSVSESDTIHKVEATILEDQEVKISVGFQKRIIDDHLHIRKLLSARCIPWILTPFQMQERVNCFQVLLAMCQENKEDFFGRLIIQNETWLR